MSNPMLDFSVVLIPEFFMETRVEGVKPDRVYPVLGIVDGSLLIRGEKGRLVEVYPKWCRVDGCVGESHGICLTGEKE